MFDQFIVQPLTSLLLWLNDFFAGWPLPPTVSSWAMALMAMAVLVKLVTYPLTASQMRSMRAMQELQPKIRALQKKYKDDREALGQKQLELYREHGVNPLGGCLPLLIQMPVLFGLFRVMTQNAELMEGARFLWVANLAIPEPLPWGEPPGLPLLLIVMVGTQFAYQRFMTPPTGGGDPSSEAMASMTKFMPLFFAFIFIRFPAALVLYYTAFNVASVAQHMSLNRSLGSRGEQLAVGDDEAVDAQPDEGKKAPAAVEATTQEKKSNASRKRRRRRKKKR